MEADVLSVREAASQLGISSQRVRQLISAGTLPARRSSAGWLVRADAIAGREQRARPGRPVSPRTAWAALWMLSAALEPDPAAPDVGVKPDRRLRHHVLRLLSAMPDPADDPGRWRLLLASRGHRERMWAHPGLLPRLIDDPQVTLGGSTAAARAGDGLSDIPERDLYVDEGDARQVIARYRLRPDPDGQVRLHVVPASVPRELSPGHAQRMPAAAAAADMLDEEDPRARRSAQLQLRAMLDALLAEHEIRPSSEPGAAAADHRPDESL